LPTLGELSDPAALAVRRHSAGHDDGKKGRKEVLLARPAFHIHAQLLRKEETMAPPQTQALAEVFQLPHRIPIYWDPVPPWILHVLKDEVLKELAVSQLEFQKGLLDLQGKALERSLAILKRG